MIRFLSRAVPAAAVSFLASTGFATSLNDQIHLTETFTGASGSYIPVGETDPQPCEASSTTNSTESIYVSDSEGIISFRYSAGTAGEFQPFDRYVPPGELFGKVDTYYPDDYGTVLRFKGVFLTSQINAELRGKVVVSTNYGCTFYSNVRGALALSRRVIELEKEEVDAKQWFDTGEALHMINNFIKDKVLKPLVEKPEGGLKDGVEVQTRRVRNAGGGVRG